MPVHLSAQKMCHKNQDILNNRKMFYWNNTKSRIDKVIYEIKKDTIIYKNPVSAHFPFSSSRWILYNSGTPQKINRLELAANRMSKISFMVAWMVPNALWRFE